MNKIAERKKLRRKYLARKLGTSSLVLLSYVLTLLGVGGILLIGAWCITGPWGMIRLPISFLYFMPLFLLMVIGWITIYTVQWPGELLNKAKELNRENPYVPPVTANTLPADQILIRSSHSPEDQSHVLLRATTPHQTPHEELLRVSRE